MRVKAMRMQNIPTDFSGFEVLLGKVVAIGISLAALWKGGRFFIRRIGAGWATLKQFTGAVDMLGKLTEGLALQAARQSTLIDMNPQPFFQADPLGRITGANAALLRLLEIPMPELTGQGWENIVHADDYRDVSAAWDEAIREKRQFLRTYRIQTPRETIKVRVWARPVFSMKNELVEFQGTFAEVARRPITQT